MSRSAPRSGLLVLALAAACAGPKPRATIAGPSARELFPLSVGNRWTYEVGFLGAREALTVSIVAAEGHLYRDSRGQRFHSSADGLRDEHRYLLKEPIEVGRRWTSVVDVKTAEHYQIHDVGVTVDVPAGHLEGCVRIESRSPQDRDRTLLAEQVYCPGVGLASVETFEETQGRRGPVQWSQRLTSFSVK